MGPVDDDHAFEVTAVERANAVIKCRARFGPLRTSFISNIFAVKLGFGFRIHRIFEQRQQGHFLLLHVS